MKHYLLLTFFCSIFLNVFSQDISSIQKKEGTHYITYTIGKNEGLQDIATKFSLKSITLAKYNNLTLNSIVNPFQTINIPLTETNFFRLKAINYNKEYLPVYYEIEESNSKKNICDEQGLQQDIFDKWNLTNRKENYEEGDKVIVGWLKFSTNATNFTFDIGSNHKRNNVVIEKNINDLNAVANNKKATSESELSKIKKSIFKNDIPTPKNNITIKKIERTTEKNEIIETANTPIKIIQNEKKIITAKNVEKKYIESNSQLQHSETAIPKVSFWNSLKNKFKKGGYEPYRNNVAVNNSIANKNANISKQKIVTPAAPINNIVSTPLKISNKPDAPQKPKNVPKTNKKEKAPTFEIVKNDPNRMTNKLKEDSKEFYGKVKNLFKSKNEIPVKTSNTIVSKERNTDVRNNIKANAKNNNVVVKTKNELINSNSSVTKIAEPIVANPIKNEVKQLSLLNAKNGKASLFYSGFKGGKIYVVTNVAKHGEIVKITNTSNGKFVMAEVLNSLPSIDVSKGLLIKLSDNAKLPLGISNSSFNVKINY